MASARHHDAPWALASLALAMGLSSLGSSIANVGLPALAQAFGAPFQQVQWVVLAYLLAITISIVSVGRLGDLIGRRRLLLAGVALFTLASLLCGLAPTLPLLLAARALQGLGAAVMMALTLAMVGGTVPKEKTGSAMGLLGTASAVGTALGPSLGGVLIAGLGWQSMFLAQVPLGAAALLLGWRHLPPDGHSAPVQRPRFDGLGTLLLAFALAAYTLAMTLGHGHFGALNAALLVAATVGGTLFLAVQARVASPLVRLAMLRDRVLRTGLATSALVATVLMATLVVGPFYLSHALGLPMVMVGLVVAIGPVVAALAGVPAGRLVDSLGAQRMTLAGLGGVALGAAALALLPASSGVPGYALPIAVITAGYALFQAANNTAVMAGARADQRSVVSGLLNLSRNLGLVTGASAMGAVFAWASSAADIATAPAEAVALGMRVTLAVAAGLIGVAMAISASEVLRRPQGQ